MPDDTVLIVGDGPTGLSAALFLAKNKLHVQVVGGDGTPVHKAMLYNYLGDEAVPGPEFLERARRQVQAFGGELHKGTVERIELGEPFRAVTPERTFEGSYLVLATGFERGLAESLGLEKGPEGLHVDPNGRTSRERVYAGGSLTRGTKTQVATSVGDGAAIALDILSRVRGKPTHDFDVLKPQTEAQAGSR